MDLTVLDQAEFADNPEPRCPVVLLLDTSGSMHGEPIEAVRGKAPEMQNICSTKYAANRVVDL